MKLYISADLEGACGVVSPHQCSPHPDQDAYEWAVGQLELEVSAVVEASLEAGATEIVVNDAHCRMINLVLEQIDPRVSLLSGKPKPCAMFAGLDASFDAAMQIGYHAKAGTEKGVLSHTFHHKLFDVSVNGNSYGEGGINALYASLTHGVPLVLGSGDAAYDAEIRQLIPNLTTVITKDGHGQTAALSRPLESVIADYTAKTAAVLADAASWKQNLLKLTGPYIVRMTFINPLCADAAMLIPGPTRVDGRTLEYRADDFETAYRMLQACYTMQAAPTDFLS